MKFLIVLCIIAFVTVKSIFGVVSIAGETVYNSSHKTDTLLQEALK